MKIVSSKNTHIIIIHNNGSSAGGSAGVFRRALETEPAAGIVFEGLTKNRIINSNGNTVIAIPGQWQVESSPGVNEIFRCVTNYLAWPGKIPKPRADTLLVISNGRFITRVDIKWLGGMLESFDEDLVSVNVEPGLRSYRENVSITSRGDVVGIRRLYSNSVLPEPAVNDWPHHIFIKAGVVDKVTAEGVLPLKFGDFADRCREASLTWGALR